nr:hypothetical protein [uncultured Draconibacterium sp.]
MNLSLKSIVTKGIYILGIIGSIASIAAIISEPKFQKPTIIVGLLLVIGTIVYLTTNYLYRRRKEIRDLQVRVGILEKTQRVPFFKKWPLIYSHLWKSGEVTPNNQIDLVNLELKVKIRDGNKFRDALCSYRFVGKHTKESWNIKIVIGGDGIIDYSQLKFSAVDNLRNMTLRARISDKGRNTTVKDIIISFDTLKKENEYFDLTLEWEWPKMLFFSSDYIALPNIFSDRTQNLRIMLQKSNEMNLRVVEAYKYGISDDKPTFLRAVYPSNLNKDLYIFELMNPEKDADYLLYYET